MTIRMGRAGLALLLGAVACGEAPGAPQGPVGPAGTPELRAALFDTIMARTERREAFSPPKEAALGYDPLADMRALRDRVVSANSQIDLYYALAALSHARRDRHLDLYLVPGGLELPDSAGLDVWGGEAQPPLAAPVRVFPDFGVDGAAFFVGDVAPGARWLELPSVGDRVTSVQGLPVAEWAERATAYTRHSSVAGLRWKLAEAMTLATAALPPELRGDSLSLGVAGDADGAGASGETERVYRLAFADTSALAWSGASEPAYPGFSVRSSTTTYDLRVADDGRPVIILVWTGFRETMVQDVDALMALAEADGLLDHTVVVDVTRSGGGSFGPYALQRLQPRPFRTTFGNLRLSDVIEPFVAAAREATAAGSVNRGGVPGFIDDGAWLMEWLEGDLLPALARGDDYSGAVPFKLAHAPKDSDGVIAPAPVHFRGGFAVLSGPHGGSHLDQFVHIVVDNDLGPVVGLPPGGYTNTWEWEEILTFPGTEQPVVGFMWNIGHTLTPGGEIGEGNPAEIDEVVPLTPQSLAGYYPHLLERALARLAQGGP